MVRDTFQKNRLNKKNRNLETKSYHAEQIFKNMLLGLLIYLQASVNINTDANQMENTCSHSFQSSSTKSLFQPKRTLKLKEKMYRTSMEQNHIFLILSVSNLTSTEYLIHLK